MKTAIIGAGGISEPHAQAIASLGIQIAGVLDADENRARVLAGRYGGRVIYDLDEILDEIDMIHLLTPPSERVEYVRKAAAAGKHILIEKPIAAAVDDAKEIIALAKAGGVKLMVNFNHRFRDGFLLLKEAFDSGALGEIVSIYSHRFGVGHGFLGVLKPGWRTQKDLLCGMCVESLSHDIDMILQIAGGVDSVSAVVSGTIAELPGFDNNAVVAFRTEKGAVGSIHASWTSHLGHSERGVIGTKGSAAISGGDLFNFEEFTIRKEDMPYPRVTKIGDIFNLSRIGAESFQRTNAHFFDCIKSGAEPQATGEDGLNALIFSHAALESSRLGKAVPVNIRRNTA
jgi:predicted dehydrogenase